MGHYDNCRPGYCAVCGAAPGNFKKGICMFCKKRGTQNEAQQARDEALERVSANAGKPWNTLAQEYLDRFLLSHSLFIGEEFRLWALKKGMRKPHHHNAWGAALRAGARAGVIEMTNSMRQMSTKKSHARLSPVWRRTV